MLPPNIRRLLESGRIGNASNITSGVPSITSGGSEDVFTGNSSFFFNGTGVADLGEGEFGFSDMQTVFLACIATLIPLVFILLAAIGVRFMWQRLRARKGEGYEGVLQREESSDPLAVKSLSASGNLLTDELKTSESQFSVTPAEEIEDITSQAPLLSYGASSGSMPNHTSKNANGSIITMTLKNNHLIVETEETGVTDGSTKTTTTKFTASASPHENNVFVVEVQQGGTPRNTDCFRENSEVYPKLNSSAVSSQEDIDEEDLLRRSSSQRAQVHRPPDIDIDEVSDVDDLEDIDDEEEEEDDTTGRGARTGDDHGGSTNTGLSQSDLSISSSGSNNPSYRYGNQLGYEGGHFGYPQYVGYGSTGDEKVSRTVGASSSGSGSCGKVPIPRVYAPASISMKRASSVTEPTQKPFSNPGRSRYSIDITPVSTRLLSDLQAERRRQIEDDRLQEEQRQLGNGTVKANKVAPLAVANGDSTPSPVEEEQTTDKKTEENNKVDDSTLKRTGSLPSKMKKEESKATGEDANDISPKPEAPGENATPDAIQEKAEGDVVSAGKKRASLPVINPELYTQIKQTTKSLILDKASRPGLSPKFEKFRNENSPLDETEKDDTQQVPDSTSAKTQEYENEGFVPSDQITS